jgi:hypothetical protein
MTNKDGKLVALSTLPTEAPVDYERDFGLAADIEWLMYLSMDADNLAKRASDVDVVVIVPVGNRPVPDFRMFPNLQAVLVGSAGYEVLAPEMIPEGCLVTNTFEHEYSIAD